MSEKVRVHSHRYEDVAQDTLATVASEFMEWLDGEGYRLQSPEGRPDDEAYTDLARAWAGVVQTRGGNVG